MQNGIASFEVRYEELLTEAVGMALDYLRGIRERHVGVTREGLEGLSHLAEPLSERGADPRTVLELLNQFGAPATTASTGGRFFGGVVGGSLPVSLAAHWIAAAWDQNACLFDYSPVSAFLEDVVLDWLCRLLRLPEGSGGAFVTGTQMAHVTALAAARNSLLKKAGWDVHANGLFGAPLLTIVVGEEVHATVLKALRILGIGAHQLIAVPCDKQGRIIPSRIPRLRNPAIICAQLGNVNTGSCDSLSKICDVASEFNAWVHVDGAFGLWAAASSNRRYLTEGLERAHSWATDAHKWLNVPYDSGVAIVRNREDLQETMTIAGSYYPDPAGKREPMKWGPESSRRARAVEIWAALRTLGSEGVEHLIERTCELAALFAERLRAAGYDVLNEVVLNQVLVRFGDDEITNQIVARIQEEGTCWCSGTTWKGRRAMRISVSSWATTESDVARSLEAILTIAQEAIAKHVD